MLTGLLLGVVVILRCFPETAAARWLARQVAEVRARFAKIERRHLVFLALMALVVAVGGELLAIGGPLDAGLVLLWDVATYVDIVLAGATIATVARGRAGLRLLLARQPRLPRARARRSRPAKRFRRAVANDDDDRPAAFAA